ncbi:MAG TPA: HNH endonuclease signature motif containing protein [Solirubrobacterales bacterium]|nr:HNH endonuclease signature motif containing protein [Solirubrobacterales bacterium]
MGVKTSRAKIAEYWLGTEEGPLRYPNNPALMDFGEPHCFACGEPGNWPEGQLWSLWNQSRLERCHLVPRMLGGADSPENLVLLCSECHHDAPDVGDPSYMLGWMTKRESRFARLGPLMTEAIEEAGLSGELDRLGCDDWPRMKEVTDEVIKTWVGFHGSRISPATIVSTYVEVVRRISEEWSRRADA